MQLKKQPSLSPYHRARVAWRPREETTINPRLPLNKFDASINEVYILCAIGNPQGGLHSVLGLFREYCC